MEKSQDSSNIKVHCTMFYVSKTIKGDKREREIGIPSTADFTSNSDMYFVIPAYGQSIDISGPEL